VRWLWFLALLGPALAIAVVTGWGEEKPAPRGLLDDMADPTLHGLPIPHGFRVVARSELPHTFDNEPVLPESAFITIRMRAPVPVSIAPLLWEVEQKLMPNWTCLDAAARLGIAGYSDTIECGRGDVGVTYATADWDTPNWRRRKWARMTVTVWTPTPGE
jgi:hypothetical protein